MEHGSEIAYLQRRKGFVRIAMEMGKPLVPVFCFGPVDVYKWWKPSGKLYPGSLGSLSSLQFFSGGVLGSPLPFQRPMHVVVGRPIVLKKNPEPTADESLKCTISLLKHCENCLKAQKRGLIIERSPSENSLMLCPILH
ncbi:Diacylglycerol O-acyltransferase 2 [Datura stramonium]|uniref:Diacylglycerol O-acyltransferase 2 n=1 Tax=Datura stramonium TaxID=4076 RepID=A0ABS8TCC8_DATST|nr:Diacylglycerol O-acyltransferase 2 [Datura stramonium]